MICDMCSAVYAPSPPSTNCPTCGWHSVPKYRDLAKHAEWIEHGKPNYFPISPAVFPDSLRDYFAGLAMSGMSAANPVATYDQVASFAYEMADAMLEARKPKEEG